MQRVIERDPSWLDRFTPAAQLFKPSKEKEPRATQSKNSPYTGPLKRIAHRGTEVFVAVGNELRWSEVTALKEAAEDRPFHGENGDVREGRKCYRVSQSKMKDGLHDYMTGNIRADGFSLCSS